MSKYTEEEIQAFLNYEQESDIVGEMISEQRAEAWMNARNSGMDRPSPDALPSWSDFELIEPDGYKAAMQYYHFNFAIAWEEVQALQAIDPEAAKELEIKAINYPLHVLETMVGVDKAVVEKWYQEKLTAEVDELELDLERDPDWDQWIEPPF